MLRGGEGSCLKPDSLLESSSRRFDSPPATSALPPSPAGRPPPPPRPRRGRSLGLECWRHSKSLEQNSSREAPPQPGGGVGVRVGGGADRGALGAPDLPLRGVPDRGGVRPPPEGRRRRGRGRGRGARAGAGRPPCSKQGGIGAWGSSGLAGRDGGQLQPGGRPPPPAVAVGPAADGGDAAAPAAAQEEAAGGCAAPRGGGRLAGGASGEPRGLRRAGAGADPHGPVGVRGGPLQVRGPGGPAR